MIYETCAETAKRVRKSLKAKFPGVKFSVRSKTYSGGGSIDVSWTGGPTSDQVQKITCEFEGSSFDGMIDLKSPRRAEIAHADGCIEEISHGADYIFCNRHIPEQVWVDAANVILHQFGRETRVETMEDINKSQERFGTCWLQQVTHREVKDKELPIQ